MIRNINLKLDFRLFLEIVGGVFKMMKPETLDWVCQLSCCLFLSGCSTFPVWFSSGEMILHFCKITTRWRHCADSKAVHAEDFLFSLKLVNLWILYIYSPPQHQYIRENEQFSVIDVISNLPQIQSFVPQKSCFLYNDLRTFISDLLRGLELVAFCASVCLFSSSVAQIGPLIGVCVTAMW